MAGTHAAQLTEKKLQMRIELGEGARVMRGDERLLTLVLKNLLDNAIKYTQQGGVTVRTYLVSGQRSGVSEHKGTENTEQGAGQNGDGSRFILEVRDTGIGVPADDQERVFERFYTVNRSRGGADRGTGLGLSIVKHAVNAMHGTVSLESPADQGGKGTVVRCAFPAEALN
jgi:two-component system phosphate regulon sensor histidine kinase PhoR